MNTAASTSPTLSLVIRAPEALEVLAALRLGIKELKAETAGLGQGFSNVGTAGVARLEAQVNELTAALATSKLELTQIQARMESTSAAGIKAIQAEKTAILDKNRVAREEAKKTAQAEEDAQLRRLTAAETALAKLSRLPITSADPNVKQRLGAESLTDLENQVGVNRALSAQRAAEQAQQVQLQRLAEADYVRAHAEAVSENAAIDRAATARRAAEQAQQLAAHRLNEADYVRAHAEAAAENARIDKASAAQRVAISREAAAAEREANSTARGFGRGVAGGAGALWLTYGSTGPLLAGLAIAASIREAIKAGSEFQYQMEFTRAIIDETGEHAKLAGDKFRKMAEDSQFSGVEIARGSRVLAQAGFQNFNEILGTLPSVLKLAAVGELDVANAAEIAAGNMNAFGLSVADIPGITNSLAKAAVLSQTNIKEMGEALKQVGPIAQQAGVGINDMNALLAVLATRNIRSTAAGTSLANVLRELISPSAKGADALKRLGIDAIDPITGKMKEAVPLLQEFLNVYRQFDPQSQGVLINEIFNNRASKGFVTELAEATTRLPDFSTKIKEAYKEANFLDTVMQGLNQTFQYQAKEALHTLQNAFIEAFQGSGKELTGLATSAKQLFASEEFRTFITSMVSGFARIAELAVNTASAIGKVYEVMKALKTLTGGESTADSFARGAAYAQFYALGALADKVQELLKKGADAVLASAAQSAANGVGTKTPAELKREADMKAWEDRGAAELERQRNVLANAPTSGTLKFNLPSKTIAAEKSDILSDINAQVKALEQGTRYTKEIYDKQRAAFLITEEDYQEKVELLERDKVTKLQTINAIGLSELVKLEKDASNEIIGLNQQRTLTEVEEARKSELNANQIRIRTAEREIRDRQAQLTAEARHQYVLAGITRQGKEKAANDAAVTARLKLSQDADQSLRKAQEQFDISQAPERDQIAQRAVLQVQEQFYGRIADLHRDIAKAEEDAHGTQTKRLTDLNYELSATISLEVVKEDAARKQALRNYEESRKASTGIKLALQTYTAAATNNAAQYGGLITNIFRQAEASMLQFFTTGKFGFRDFAKFAVQELLKIQIAKILAGVATVASSYYSGTGANQTGGYGYFNTPAKHSGGIVGLERSFTRGVSLPKFHDGGVVGDEQMIIARKKEGVFTPAQMRALAPVGSGGGNYVININVTNNGQGQPDSNTSGTAPDAMAQGLRRVVVEEIVRQQRQGGVLAQS